VYFYVSGERVGLCVGKQYILEKLINGLNELLKT